MDSRTVLTFCDIPRSGCSRVNLLLTDCGRYGFLFTQIRVRLMNSPIPSAASVRDLQERAKLAARPASGRKSRLSRAARLHLIDVLSRTGGTGLALAAGVSIFVAVSNGRDAPFRAGVWLMLICAAIYFCRRLRRDFRAGERITASPFRWRANYTSALAVLGAALGAGAMITAPVGSGAVFATGALIFIAAGGGAAAHLAHGRSAAALFVPAAAFIVAAFARESLMLALSVAFGSLLAGAGLFAASRRLQAHAAARFPRTGFVRRAVDADPLSDTQTIAPQADAV